FFFFFQAEDGIRDFHVTGVQTCALPIFDARGYGKTRSQNVSFSNREDIRRLLDHLGIDSATLIGNSRGGIMAIDFALEHPDRVRSEERRVGKECRSGGGAQDGREKAGEW